MSVGVLPDVEFLRIVTDAFYYLAGVPGELRLAIFSEVVALVSDLGGEAYAEACRHASEASSDSLARDWSIVAATIARRSGRRSSLLDALFG
jgi:hypothetical protein